MPVALACGKGLRYGFAIMSRSETARHLELKRQALIRAQAQGYRAAAAEVSLPSYRFRLDFAAYRPDRVREVQP